MDSAYHGSYEGVEFDGAADSANGATSTARLVPTSRGVPRSMAENVLTMPFDDGTPPTGSLRSIGTS